MTEAAQHGEDLTRTAELSCCGGVCPNCAPVMGLSLLSAFARRAMDRLRHDREPGPGPAAPEMQEAGAGLPAELPEAGELPGNV